MIKEVYDAFREANVSEETASKAAQAMASYDDRFNKVDANLLLLKSICVFNLGVSMTILWKVFG